jgi:hypothetical protein
LRQAIGRKAARARTCAHLNRPGERWMRLQQRASESQFETGYAGSGVRMLCTSCCAADRSGRPAVFLRVARQMLLEDVPGWKSTTTARKWRQGGQALGYIVLVTISDRSIRGLWTLLD